MVPGPPGRGPIPSRAVVRGVPEVGRAIGPDTSERMFD